MSDTQFTQLTVEQYLSELSSEKPVPGGGSVSALVASYAMGLTQMVARVALKRKKKKDLSSEDAKRDEENRAMTQKILESVEKIKKDAFQIVDLDPKIYNEVMAAWGDPEKQDDALQNSFRLQAELALLIVMAKEFNMHLAGCVKGSIKNDLLVSAALSEGAFKGAFHTAMVNAVYMKDEEKKRRAEHALEELKNRFEKEAPGASQRS